MKATIIISVYKDVQALNIIIEALQNQSYPIDEIIISEDGNSKEIKEYFSSLKFKNIKHLSQDDNGWQKNRALNRAIQASNNEYLIFIDGDCVPYSNFIESHLKLQEKKTVLCGRRTEPGEKFSKQLREESLSIKDFTKNYIKNYFQLKKDQIRHYDEGFYFHHNSMILKLLAFIRRKKENHIVGCNFSCWKEDLEKINGFDEDFLLPTTGEDSDIERRMKHFGVKMKSCRYSANTIHLYHEKLFNPEISSKTEALMETKKDIFICKSGLKKLN